VLVDDLRGRLEDPERQISTIDIWRRYVDEHATQAQQNRRAFLAMMRVALDTPELRRTLLEISAALEAVLLDGLTADLGGRRGRDLSTRLLATTLAHGNRVALERWVTGGGKGNLRADAVAVIDLAEQTLGANHYPVRTPGARARGADFDRS
jgi:hypothetical protein